MSKKFKLLYNGNKVLNSVSSELTFPLSNFEKSLINDLTDYMEKETPTAQGLSAVQVGICKRFAIMYINSKRFVIINPIVKYKFAIQISKESCLSVDYSKNNRDYYKVKRPLFAIIEYYDINGNKKSIFTNKHDTRIYCHEIDHMNGILINNIGKFYCTKIVN